ncbi:MAG: hypothetical protein ACRES4_10975, partial [Nevskiales bacterium]
VSQGFNIWCPTLDEQVQWLAARGLGEDFIPWNTDNRRNIGFLAAAERGVDLLVSIDDDNFCRGESDFVGEHAVVGRPLSAAHNADWAAGAGWFNICSLLEHSAGDAIYARGFPYKVRNPGAQARLSGIPDAASNCIVALNAGLWLDDPDVDAITRLSLRPRVARAAGRAVILSHETWSPINTQNTGLMGAAIPAYYYVRMGFRLQGLRIDRFGDILSGYFIQKCAKHLGHVLRLGSPVADHVRSTHNLFKDLYFELAGIVLVEELLPWLQELRLEGSSYAEAYASLADALAADSGRFTGFVWDEGGRDFLASTTDCMRQWLGVVARVSR